MLRSQRSSLFRAECKWQRRKKFYNNHSRLSPTCSGKKTIKDPGVYPIDTFTGYLVPLLVRLGLGWQLQWCHNTQQNDIQHNNTNCNIGLAFMLPCISFSIIRLNVVMLSVGRLNVVAPCQQPSKRLPNLLGYLLM
jgi:hypothetical protein